ncbi:glycosyl transferase family 6 [Motilibacter peucedani]|uniref:Glycosyl transferase family 6 n=1 Tax=Motilibacter peucedani TaxID=598650 RepID=A0A420XU68_9ACTN|nr:hypothetical protein [Motilibacter peucedani]RKS80307.1 glycosyl transferase family 6 [Motilibacter peucedani]
MTRSVGLLVIATGRYVQFADDLVRDVEEHLVDAAEVTLNLFTDAAPDELAARWPSRTVRLNVLPVPALRWPEASLYRYELFSRAGDDLVGDELVYLDSDLRIVRPFLDQVRPADWPGQLAAVRHPGYYRPRQVRPRGTWETRRESTARVPRWRQRRYVCGGVWMGSRGSVLGMSTELAEHVRTDASRGVTAVWHDESHWNWWVANRPTAVLDPRFCYVPDYPWLEGLDPYVLAVDKGASFVREATDASARTALMGGPPDGGQREAPEGGPHPSP